MIGLANDERRCLIHNLRVEKHWGSKNCFSNK